VTGAPAVGVPHRHRHAARLPLARQRQAYRLTLLLTDALALAAAFGAAFALRFRADLPFFQAEIAGNVPFYARLVLLLIPLWLAVFRLVGLYNHHNLLGGTREYSQLFHGVSTGMLMVVLLTFLEPTFIIARGWLLSAWVLAFLFIALARFALRRVVYHLRTRGYFVTAAVVVGTNPEAVALAEQLATWRTSGLDVKGCVATNIEAERDPAPDIATLGAIADLERLVTRLGIEEVVVATSAVSRQELVDLFRLFAADRRVQLRLSSGLFEVMTTGLEIKELAYVPLINVRPVRLSGIDTALKALLDYGVALAVLVLLWPLLVVVALAVRLDTPGPVIHRRRVLGLGGTEFDALKFRTMCVHGDQILARRPELMRQLAQRGKLTRDPRVTRVGRLLRRTSLDELPQVLNVLAGQMSIVGPRMITADEHHRYGQWDLNLLTVKPGLTGLWQVSGRSDVSYEERVQLDMNYIRNWTIWLDLYILMKTVPAVLKGRGAY